MSTASLSARMASQSTPANHERYPAGSWGGARRKWIETCPPAQPLTNCRLAKTPVPTDIGRRSMVNTFGRAYRNQDGSDRGTKKVFSGHRELRSSAVARQSSTRFGHSKRALAAFPNVDGRGRRTPLVWMRELHQSARAAEVSIRTLKHIGLHANLAGSSDDSSGLGVREVTARAPVAAILQRLGGALCGSPQERNGGFRAKAYSAILNRPRTQPGRNNRRRRKTVPARELVSGAAMRAERRLFRAIPAIPGRGVCRRPPRTRGATVLFSEVTEYAMRFTS